MLRMRKLASVLVIGILSVSAKATDKFDYYFNQSLEFESKVAKPSETLGYPIGDWHLRPDQSYAFFQRLAETSDRVILQQTGRTHEQRPLIASFISSPENLARLDETQQKRKALDFTDVPNVVYLGYSVHGNEPSGANAAPLVAYRLAASKEDWIKQLLENTIVVIDPMLNPDGMDRFANWVNRYKGAQLVSDPRSIELNEDWPRGRANHYWFDLNRDWLLLQHPESRARVKLFYDWRPTIVGDFHEMFPNSTYFFQPGVPSRQNPLTSQENFDVTNKIAAYHAKALDKLGVSYYSKESFDDFYYGKGSTFPDINGGIGILFEQASSRGHAQDSDYGGLTFPFTVRNQVATSFSTLTAAKKLSSELKKYQQDFFAEQQQKASKDAFKAIAFSSNDEGRIKEFLTLMSQHQVKVEKLAKDKTFLGKTYKADSTYIVPLKQAQYGLIKAMFEKRTRFKDNTFYDVSAWTLPLAFNFDFKFLNGSQYFALETEKVSSKQGQLIDSESAIAYVFSNDNFYSLSLAQRLMNAGYSVRLNTKPFTSNANDLNSSGEYGTGHLIVSLDGKKSSDKLKKIWSEFGQNKGIDLTALDTGFAKKGIDLGSPSVEVLSSAKPLLLIGEGVSSTEAGEVWFQLDQRLQIPVSMQKAKKLPSIDLETYSHLIMVSGSYPDLNETELASFKSWLNSGGNIIASRSAVNWLIKHKLADLVLAKRPKLDNSERPYAERGESFAEQIIGGAIFKTELDVTHPLTYGLNAKTLPVTKAGVQILEQPKQSFVTLARYSNNPLMAGYASDENIEAIKGTPAVIAMRKGRGSIVVFNDNLNFRGYWMGSARLFLNSLYFNKAF